MLLSFDFVHNQECHAAFRLAQHLQLKLDESVKVGNVKHELHHAQKQKKTCNI